MNKLVFVPALMLAALTACGMEPNIDEDQVQIGDGDGDGHDEGGDDEVPTPTLTPDIAIMTETCTRTVAHYEAYGYGGDPSVVCKWTFDDGATSNECIGSHEFATSGDHHFILEVTDLDTGAVGRAEQTRFFHPPLALTLEVSSDDLTISYTASSNTGGEQVVFVSPAELVVADDPNYPTSTTGTVRVLEAGTYTVTYDVEDERGVSEICSGQIVKTIEAACTEHNVGH